MLSVGSSCGLGEGVSDGLTARRVIQEGRHREEVKIQERVFSERRWNKATLQEEMGCRNWKVGGDGSSADSQMSDAVL